MLGLRCSLYLMVFTLYIVTWESKVRGYEPPRNCKLEDCPIYNVIYSGKEFEIRNYSKALWTSYPTIVEYSIIGGIGNGDAKLIDYYNGKNDQGVDIVKGSPILMMDVLKNSSYTVHLYVPEKYQNGGIPKPLLPEIKQEKLPDFKYAAVRKSREIIDYNIALEMGAFKISLQGTAYQRASLRDQFSLILYDAGTFNEGFELVLWFD